MSNHGSATGSPFFFFMVTIVWLAIASVQAGGPNALQNDFYGTASGEFLAGYPSDRDPSLNPNRNTESPYGARFLSEMNADDQPSSVASESFRYYPSDRSSYDPYAKRNIDEIDRTAFDNFFKRNNLNEIDQIGWNKLANRLASYLTSRASRTSRTSRNGRTQ